MPPHPGPPRRAARKQRIDVMLVELGLAPTLERAKSLLMAGKVLVNGQPLSKAGTDVAIDATITLKEEEVPFVSRGGVKLLGALKAFGLDVTGLVCIDVGASTGGFTDCLLQQGALKVYAIDVGHGLLDWGLRNDPRVINIERLNARYLDQHPFPEKMDLAVMDLSFISLSQVLPPLKHHLKPGARVLAMVKPQFEVAPQDVGKAGVVRDEAVRQRAIEDVQAAALQIGYHLLAEAPSTLAGAKGNVEHFLLLAFPPLPTEGAS